MASDCCDCCTPAKEKEKEGEEVPGTKFRDWALKTAGTIIGGLGLATWMVIVGSAVIWARFDEAGFPPLQAVAVQPRSEALIQGAQVTLLCVLIAVAAVSLMYVLDSHDTEAEAGAPAQPHRTGWKTLGLVVVLALAGIVWAIRWTELGVGSVFILGVLAVGLAFASLRIGLSRRKNFWALAGVVFVAIVAFAGVADFLIVKEQKFVQAVAILRDEDDEGVHGYLVAATDEKIYIANAIGPDMPARKPMQVIKIGDDTTYSVGPLEDQEDATARTRSMLNRLKLIREKNPPDPKPAEAAKEDPSTKDGGKEDAPDKAKAANKQESTAK